jgi:hypothetical protein
VGGLSSRCRRGRQRHRRRHGVVLGTRTTLGRDGTSPPQSPRRWRGRHRSDPAPLSPNPSHRGSGHSRQLCAKSFGALLYHRQGCAACWAIAFKAAFGEMEQERLGCSDTALDSTFSDSHHLPEDCLVGCFAPSPAWTPGSIAALALHIARRPWRPTISAAILLVVFGWTALRHHLSVPRGQRRQSGSRVQRRISLRSLSVRCWPPRRRRRAAWTTPGSRRSCRWNGDCGFC